MNTNNGGLFIEVGFNQEDIEKEVEKINKKILGFGNMAEFHGKKLDNIFNSIAGSAGSVEKALADAGHSMDSLFNGNVLENLKASNLQLGLTGQELREAARDAEKLVDALDSNLQLTIMETKDALDKIAQMPEGNDKQRLMFDLAGETVEIEKAAATLQQMKDFVADVKEESKSLAQRMGEVTQEMQRLDAAGQRDSARYDELRKKAIDYSESIQRVNDEIKIVTKGDALGGLMSVANAVSSAFSIGAGAVGLFAKENENLAAIQQRVQSITAIAVGVSQAYNDVSREGSTIVAGLTKVQEFFIVVQNRLASAFNLSEKAARGWTMALSLGVFAAVTAVIYLYQKYSEEMERAQRAQKALNEAALEGAKNAAQEVTQLQLLYAAATDVSRSLEDRKKAVDKLQEQYPSYFKNLSAEAIMAGNAANSYRELRREIIAASQAKAAQGKIDKLNEDYLEREEKLKAKMRDAAKRARNPKGSVEYDYTTGQPLRNVSAEENKRKAVAEFKAYTAELTNLYRERNRALDPLIKYVGNKENAAANYLNDQDKPKKVADNSMGKRLSVIKKRLQELKAQGKEGTAEFKNLLEEAKKLDSTMDEINETIDPKSPKKPKPAKPKADKPDKKNPQDVAEEIIPAGSVAEIRKRLQAIDEALSKANNDNIISILRDQRIATAKELAEAEAKISTEAKKEEISDEQKLYEEFLKIHQTFEQQRAAISEKYNKIRAEIDRSTNTPEEKERLKTVAAEAEGKEISDALLKGMEANPEWQEAFGRIETFTVDKLQKLRKSLINKLQTLSSENAAPESIKAVQEQIAKLEKQIANTAPAFRIIKNGIKAIGDESLSTEEKLQAMDDALAAYKKVSDEVKEIISGVKDVFVSLGGEMDSAFGDVLNSLEQTMSGLDQFAEGAAKALEGFASGNMLQAAAGAIKAIAGVIKAVSGWLSGDNKKERFIKKQASALKELENAYNSLAFAAERAIGAQKYDGQRELIKNLEQQKAAIENMQRLESAKKKADAAKVAEYKSQIQQINQSITELKEGIIKDVLQTDIPDMASKMGDALVEAFGKGEDSVKAINAAFDDMIKNIMRNQLNLILQKQFEPVYKNMLKAAGFNQDGSGVFDGFTQSELEDLRAQVQNATQQGQSFIEAYKEIFKGISDTDVQGLKGDIKGVSEKTAGALEGQINAMRINQVSSMEIMRGSLLQLTQIEANTRNLFAIKTEITELNSKFKAGRLAGINL